MEVLSNLTPKARKQHKCSYCYGVIEKGEIYNRSAIKGDDFYVWKSHLRCDRIANKLRMFDNVDEGLTADDFHEYIVSEYYEILGDNQELFEVNFQDRLNYVCSYHGIE